MGLFWKCPKCLYGFGMEAKGDRWQCKDCKYEGNITEFADVLDNIKDLYWRLKLMVERIDDLEKLYEKKHIVEKVVSCPKCNKSGKESDFDVSIKQSETDFANVVGVGYKCTCGHEWGTK